MNAWQALVNAIYALWSGLSGFFKSVFDWIKEFYTLYSWSVGVFLGLLWFAVVYIFDVITWLGENVGQLLQSLESGSGIVGQQIPGPLGTGFAVANAFVPLTEAFGFLVAIGPIWMIAVTIRIIKSWVPTVN